MERRNFLNLMIGGVAAATAVRTWPFRVYSFPSNVNPFSSDPWEHMFNADKYAIYPGGHADLRFRMSYGNLMTPLLVDYTLLEDLVSPLNLGRLKP